jgi:hypothetical protein
MYMLKYTARGMDILNLDVKIFGYILDVDKKGEDTRVYVAVSAYLSHVVHQLNYDLILLTKEVVSEIGRAIPLNPAITSLV